MNNQPESDEEYLITQVVPPPKKLILHINEQELNIRISTSNKLLETDIVL